MDTATTIKGVIDTVFINYGRSNEFPDCLPQNLVVCSLYGTTWYRSQWNILSKCHQYMLAQLQCQLSLVTECQWVLFTPKLVLVWIFSFLTNRQNKQCSNKNNYRGTLHAVEIHCGTQPNPTTAFPVQLTLTTS